MILVQSVFLARDDFKRPCPMDLPHFEELSELYRSVADIQPVYEACRHLQLDVTAWPLDFEKPPCDPVSLKLCGGLLGWVAARLDPTRPPLQGH